MGRRFALDVIDIIAVVVAGYIVLAPISSPLKIFAFILTVFIYALVKWIKRIL